MATKTKNWLWEAITQTPRGGEDVLHVFAVSSCATYNVTIRFLNN